jgi:iron(III) transport system substrate-binding protein
MEETMVRRIAASVAFALFGLAAQAQGFPENYPAEYKATVAAAEKEGRVVVYSNTEQFAVNPVLEAFQAAFPKIKLDYVELKSSELYNRFVSEASAGALQADLIWSSSMDLQFKLLEEGFAQAYASPEKPALPGWAVYKDLGYGITFEPAAFIYNKRIVQEASVPKSHAELAKYLTAHASELQGKVGTYDPQRSGLGYFLLSQDLKQGNVVWDIAKGLGLAKAKQYTATGTMLEKVASGENVLAYNVVGSYALLKAQRDPSIGVVMPSDYTVAMTRVAFIPKDAKRPDAAKVFLDFLLSKAGQEVIANKALLFSMRKDVEGEATAAKLNRDLGAAVKPVAIDAELLDLLEPTKRLPFFKKWQALLEGK